MIQRAALKFALPGPLKKGLLRLRAALNGPPIEYDVMRDYGFVADDDPAPRLTLVMPELSKSKAFGGVMTGIGLYREVLEHLAAAGVAGRIVSDAAPAPGDGLGAALGGVPTEYLSANGYRLSLRAREMVMAYNWWVSLNLEPALAGQAAHFDQPQQPKIHLIQDYEPQFYAFSTAHLLARSAMGESWPLWGVFNSEELYAYWRRQGHGAEKSFVFVPVMNDALRPHLEGLGAAAKTRTMLVYGRADVPRNAFYLVEKGLQAWAARYGAARGDWRIVSAGTPHADITLGGGHVLRSLGKLSLDGYAGLLRETAVGLSLMVSPHPSYPPLEMAHFGALVVTNGYTDKDLSRAHDNIVNLPGLRPEAIAATVEAAMAHFEADPAAGVRGQSHMPDYVSGTDGVAPALAAAIAGQLNGSEP